MIAIALSFLSVYQGLHSKERYICRFLFSFEMFKTKQMAMVAILGLGLVLVAATNFVTTQSAHALRSNAPETGSGGGGVRGGTGGISAFSGNPPESNMTAAGNQTMLNTTK
jgi:hypothetical protein